uniref:Ig-like domain-containing protein n=1 Tax=Stegastes partitus TaxID=144197 RepID=A0A3B4ZQD8_9TELE
MPYHSSFRTQCRNHKRPGEQQCRLWRGVLYFCGAVCCLLRLLVTKWPPSEVKATLSQKATLSCEVADTKTEVKWYKDGKLLTSSKTIHAESKGKSRQLVIESVEKKDAGEYICEAGTEKLLVFKLQVQGRTSLA